MSLQSEPAIVFPNNYRIVNLGIIRSCFMLSVYPLPCIYLKKPFIPSLVFIIGALPIQCKALYVFNNDDAVQFQKKKSLSKSETIIGDAKLSKKSFNFYTAHQQTTLRYRLSTFEKEQQLCFFYSDTLTRRCPVIDKNVSEFISLMILEVEKNSNLCTQLRKVIVFVARCEFIKRAKRHTKKFTFCN